MQFEQFRGIVEKYGDFHASQKVIRVIEFPEDQFALIDLQNILEELEVGPSNVTLCTSSPGERASTHIIMNSLLLDNVQRIAAGFKQHFEVLYSGRLEEGNAIFVDLGSTPVNADLLFLALSELNISIENVTVQSTGYNGNGFIYVGLT